MIVLDTNLKAKNASSQYLNFSCNSIVKFGELFFCASNSGLSKLVNIDDGDEDLESTFVLATMDFGITNEKRLRAFYISFEASRDITVDISTELGTSESYTVPVTSNGQHSKRIIVSRNLKGRYWTFQVKSKKQQFSIDEITVLPIVRKHGFVGN